MLDDCVSCPSATSLDHCIFCILPVNVSWLSKSALVNLELGLLIVPFCHLPLWIHWTWSVWSVCCLNYYFVDRLIALIYESINVTLQTYRLLIHICFMLHGFMWYYRSTIIIWYCNGHDYNLMLLPNEQSVCGNHSYHMAYETLFYCMLSLLPTLYSVVCIFITVGLCDV